MKANLSGMALVTKPGPTVLESQPLDINPCDPIQELSNSIDSSDPETNMRDYVDVALLTTPVIPLSSSSRNSYNSSFSEYTSYRSLFSNSQLSAGCISYCSSFSESFGSCSQDCFLQEQSESCCLHSDNDSAGANDFSNHEPQPMEHENLGTGTYVGRDFEIPVHDFNGLDAPSFSFLQESYSSSYTASCAARNNLLAHMTAPPKTHLSIHDTKSQTAFHQFNDTFIKSEHQDTEPAEDLFDNEEWFSIDQVAPEQTWANLDHNETYVDEANILAQQGHVLGEILDVPATTAGNKTQGSWGHRADGVGEKRALAWSTPDGLLEDVS